MKNFKEKIKSYSFWTALSASVVIVINTISKNFGLSLDSEIAEKIIMGICGVLVALGIVCAPIKVEKDEKNDEENQEQKGEEEKCLGESDKKDETQKANKDEKDDVKNLSEDNKWEE